MRSSAARPVYLVMLVLLAGALGVRGPRSATAQLAGPQLCGSSTTTPPSGALPAGAAPIATNFTFECDYTTQFALLPAPATQPALVLTITNPVDLTFAGPTGLVPGSFPAASGCTTALSVGNSTLTITCPVGSAGIPMGVTLDLLLTGGATAGPIAINANYNGVGAAPTPPFPYQFDTWATMPATSASVSSANVVAPPAGVICYNTAAGKTFSTPLAAGDTFTCEVDYSFNQTPSYVVVSSANASATVNAGTVLTSRLAPDNIGYPCANNNPPLATATSVPPPTQPPAAPPSPPGACMRFFFTGTELVTGTPQFSIRSFALGAAVPYSNVSITAALGSGGLNPTAQTCGAGAAPAGPSAPAGATPVASLNPFECDYALALALAPTAAAPATLTLTITGPPGTLFTGTGLANPLPAASGCTATPVGASITIACPMGTVGLPSGTLIQLLLMGGATAGPIAMTATYTTPAGNAGPFPLPPFNYRFDTWAGVAAVTTHNGTAVPTAVTCINTSPGKAPGATIAVGDTFTCSVDYPTNQTASYVVVTTANGYAVLNAGTVTTTRPTPNNIGYPCDNDMPPPLTSTPPPIPTQPPPIPPSPPQACVRFFFTGQAAVQGTPQFTITSFALGAPQPYNTTTTVANLVAGGAVLVIGPAAPALGTGIVIGCASSTQTTDIAFPATPSPAPNQTTQGTLASTNQYTTVPPLSSTASVPAVLSVVYPNVAVECGVIVVDSGLPIDRDGNPLTIDGGTITITLSSSIAVITETNANTATINCGTSVAPAGLESCIGAVFTPAFTSQPSAIPPPAISPINVPAFISPNPTNVVHVALQPGASFPLIAATNPVVQVTATYTRYPTLGPATMLTAKPASIFVAQPPYQMTLSANPGAIAAASGLPSGSTITANIFHAALSGCISLKAGTGFVVCAGSPLLFGFGTVAGAEAGLVTFTTDAGVLAGVNDPAASAQLQYTVHCGPLLTAPPVIIVPSFGGATSYITATGFTSCLLASAILYGGGAVGTATITASYVGDITGATAQAITTVQLTQAPPPTTLSRGCNEIITGPSTPAGAPVSQIVSQIIPSSAVVGIWRFNNSTKGWDSGYFSTPGAPTDFTTVGPNQSLFVCVSGPAVFQP